MKFTGKDGTLRIYNKFYGYLEVHFTNMDMSGPLGRSKADETLVLDNGLVNSYSHYITGNDQVIFDPIPMSFSCVIEDVTGIDSSGSVRDLLYQALICRDARNPGSDNTWTGFGVSTKGTTNNKIGIANPRFLQPVGDSIDSGTITTIINVDPTTTVVTDATKSYVNGEPANFIYTFTSGGAAGKSYMASAGGFNSFVLYGDPVTAGAAPGDTYIVFDNLRTVDVELKLASPSALDMVFVMTEVYFPPSEITLSEAEDGITLSVSGGIYGVVTRSTDWVLPPATL